MIMKIKYPIGGYAPGHYMSKCLSCKEDFMGDKYARQCEPCAINTINESNKKALAELHKLKNALEKIKFSNDTINEVLGK
jgi:reverse gyrase